MGSIGASDIVFTINIIGVFASPQQLQGFANDEVTDIPALKSAEVMMGVDGIQSDGFVFVSVPQTMSFQADSASNDLFDAWWTQMVGTRSTYRASGLLKVPSIGKKYTLTSGVLTSYKPIANAKRLLQPRTYEVTWQSIAPAPN